MDVVDISSLCARCGNSSDHHTSLQCFPEIRLNEIFHRLCCDQKSLLDKFLLNAQVVITSYMCNSYETQKVEHNPMASDSKSKLGSLNTPIVRQKLSDQVFDRLWDMIQTGELSAGDFMPSERVLMEKFGVGRPAVREALQMMANKGLISISHGERSKVNKLTAGIALDQVDNIAKLLLSTDPENLAHLKQLRKILETSAVKIAAERCTPEDVANLRALVADQESKLGQDQAFIEADIAFHVALSAISGNPLIQAVTQAMLSWLFQYYKPLLLWAGRESTTLLEHARLVDCLETRDADGALRMMTDHLERSDPLYSIDT